MRCPNNRGLQTINRTIMYTGKLVYDLLFFVKDKKILNLTFKNTSYFGQCQSSRVYFTAFNVTYLVIANPCFYSKFILGDFLLQPQLAKPLTQVATKSILIFWRHGSKLSLSLAPNRPIYRVILILFLYFDMEKQTRILIDLDAGVYTSIAPPAVSFTPFDLTSTKPIIQLLN
jgi:hypothetical protein